MMNCEYLRRLIPRRIAAAVLGSAVLAVAGAMLLAQEAEPQTKRINRLIEQLGDEDYFVREQAQSELAKLSFEAFDALSAATTHEDLEIAARARYLLGLMRVEWVNNSDPPEVKNLLKDYEVQNTATKLARMRSLAKLPDAAGIPALCRLVRFEKSPVLSKSAAIKLIEMQPQAQPPTKELAETVRKHLEGSRRTAAVWLLSWLRFGQDPKTAIADWTKLVEAEYLLLGRASSQTSAQIVAGLVRIQIEWLKKLDQNDNAVLAMQRLIDLEKGDVQTLIELVDWLLRQKAWKSMDELYGQFSFRFNTHPILLYSYAQALAEQGNNDRAEQLAAKALKRNAGNDVRQLKMHLNTATELRARGMLKWAEREYRHAIQAGGPNNPVAMVAQSGLSEMLHDQGKDLEAAKVLEGLVKAVEKNPFGVAVNRAGLAAIRARMYCFFARHFQQQKDRAKQCEYLDKAIEADPGDVDVLIACYRLPDQTPEYREKILRLIQKVAAELRQRIAANPNSPTPYNQFAWLVGNTQGDLDEALKYSKKSLQLSPDSGGYYDTLAHVYFSKGDYENAVKVQTKAAELEPHSGLIARQLEVFRKRKAESRKQ